MADVEHYDYVFIGSGEAAKLTAWALGAHGKKCVLVERKYYGGSCPNTACLPSKSVVHSAQVANYVRQAASFGLSSSVISPELVKVDMSILERRNAAVVAGLRDLHEVEFNKAKSEYIEGEGRFVSPKIIEVAGRRLTGDVIVVNTGSRACVDSTILGLRESKPMTHVEILKLKELPSHLIVLGGGYVGMEFAQAYRRFGSQVTVIEKNDRLLHKEDGDVVDALTDIVAGEGVRIITSAKVDKVEGISGDNIKVSITVAGKPSNIKGSHILVATGRVPNTDNMGLEKAGIKLTPSNHILVDKHLRTSVDGVFAAGDCTGGPYFTHKGVDDFRILLSSFMGSTRPEGTSGRQIPSVLFTSHELAHVGLREHEAQAQGIKYRLAKSPMTAAPFLRTRTLGDSRGFAKILVEAKGEKILGFTALGISAGEFLPVVQLAMRLGVSYKEISSLIMAHPTMNEGLILLLQSL